MNTTPPTTPSTLRPALSLRVVHAEDQSQEYIVYVVWVCDVQSGVEWVVKKRFREFHDFREQLLTIRASLDKIEFPPKRLAVTESTVIALPTELPTSSSHNSNRTPTSSSKNNTNPNRVVSEDDVRALIRVAIRRQ
eukprot:gene30000-37146_t